jgi:hypothetical protein
MLFLHFLSQNSPPLYQIIGRNEKPPAQRGGMGIRAMPSFYTAAIAISANCF